MGPFEAIKDIEKMRNLNSLTVSKKWKGGPFCFGMAFYRMLEALDALKMKYYVHMV